MKPSSSIVPSTTSPGLGLDTSVYRRVHDLVLPCRGGATVPPNVLRGGLCRYIKSFQEPIFSPQEAGDILTRLI